MVNASTPLPSAPMASSTLNIIKVTSHNVQGLNSALKRRKIFDSYKSLTLNVIMMQETHFLVRYSSKFLHGHFPKFYLTNAENKTKGLAIVFSKMCKFNWTSEFRDTEGRFILVKGTLEGQMYSLVSYYALNKRQAEFFGHLFNTLNPMLEGTVIFGGDSNVAFDQGIDKSKSPGQQLTCPLKASHKIAKLIHAQGLNDVWRELNPSTGDFTHYSAPHHTYARINHILIHTHAIPSVTQSRIRDTILWDHAIVSMTICLTAPKSGQKPWRLNESLLWDPVRVTMLEKSLLEYFKFNSTDDTSVETVWAAHKAFIRG